MPVCQCVSVSLKSEMTYTNARIVARVEDPVPDHRTGARSTIIYSTTEYQNLAHVQAGG